MYGYKYLADGYSRVAVRRIRSGQGAGDEAATERVGRSGDAGDDRRLQLGRRRYVAVGDDGRDIDGGDQRGRHHRAGDDRHGATTAAPASSVPATTATAPATTDTTLVVADESTPMSTTELVEALASDVFTGRNEQTDGWFAAQQLLIGQLRQFAEPARAGQPGDDGYLQPIADGDNVVAIIPGTDLAAEWLVIGAHYDHLGVAGCPTADPTDSICNGATDNATGVAVAMAAARAVAEAGPRRSVLIGLWDREEDGLLGSAAYVAEPLVPLEGTVAYLNFDIQGANLLPALANTTVMVGAETGGPALREAAHGPRRLRPSTRSPSACCSVRGAATTPTSSRPASRRCSSPMPTRPATTPPLTTSASSTSPSSISRSPPRRRSPSTSPPPTSRPCSTRRHQPPRTRTRRGCSPW